MNLSELTRADATLVQAGLKALGFYNGTTRGLPGPNTKRAYNKYLKASSSRTSFGDALANIASREVGAMEVGNNGGAEVRKYQRATWLSVGAWPWCAAFVCWCVKEALETHPLVLQRPRTAGAWDFERWAKDEDVELIKPAEGTKVKRGDIVVYKFSHIGIAVADEADGRVQTVEGNTNAAGEREGDGVHRKLRNKDLIRSIIRL